MDNNLHIEEEKIINNLVSLGFSLNDSRVYFSLLSLGPSKPVKIAEYCNVDRSRVYDSLRRLTKKGFIEEEPLKRGPKYRAKNPSQILTTLREEFTNKIELSKSLEKSLEQIHSNSSQSFLMSINGETAILKEIISLIMDAKKFIQCILTPDISMNRDYLVKIVDLLVEKKKHQPIIDIEIALNVPEKTFQILLKKLFENGIKVYLWYIGNVLPYGLYLTENTYIFTTLSVDKKPTYDVGLTIENPRPGMIEGFRQQFAFNNASYFKEGKMKKMTSDLLDSEFKET